MTKAAALAGNTAMASAGGAGGAGGVFDDLENAIKELRDDLDKHLEQYSKD